MIINLSHTYVKFYYKLYCDNKVNNFAILICFYSIFCIPYNDVVKASVKIIYLCEYNGSCELVLPKY